MNNQKPRQRRAVATRQRLYEAAMAEYSRVGLDQARVEDIVAAAGVSWGTFFHYFPAKEDVLLDACALICRSYSAAIVSGLDTGSSTEDILAAAFAEMFSTSISVTGSAALRGKLLLYVISNPGRLTAFLGDNDDGLPPPVPATTAVLAAGQHRGEVRADEPAESLAVIVLYAVLFAARRGAAIGRPPGATPLGRLALQIVLRGLRPEHHVPLWPHAVLVLAVLVLSGPGRTGPGLIRVLAGRGAAAARTARRVTAAGARRLRAGQDRRPPARPGRRAPVRWRGRWPGRGPRPRRRPPWSWRRRAG